MWWMDCNTRWQSVNAILKMVHSEGVNCIESNVIANNGKPTNKLKSSDAIKRAHKRKWKKEQFFRKTKGKTCFRIDNVHFYVRFFFPHLSRCQMKFSDIKIRRERPILFMFSNRLMFDRKIMCRNLFFTHRQIRFYFTHIQFEWHRTIFIVALFFFLLLFIAYGSMGFIVSIKTKLKIMTNDEQRDKTGNFSFWKIICQTNEYRW